MLQAGSLFLKLLIVADMMMTNGSAPRVVRQRLAIDWCPAVLKSLGLQMLLFYTICKQTSRAVGPRYADKVSRTCLMPIVTTEPCLTVSQECCFSLDSHIHSLRFLSDVALSRMLVSRFDRIHARFKHLSSSPTWIQTKRVSPSVEGLLLHHPPSLLRTPALPPSPKAHPPQSKHPPHQQNQVVTRMGRVRR